MRNRERLAPEVLMRVFLIAFLVLEGYCEKNMILFKVPNKFRTGSPLHVALTLTSDSTGVTDVRVALMAHNEATVETVANETSLEPGATQLLKIQVPEILPKAQRYSVLVYSTSGEPFVNFRQVKLESKVYETALVQTDRKMYKPGQLVLFRVIHLERDLIVSKAPVTVTIIDPADIKIEMYRNVTSESGQLLKNCPNTNKEGKTPSGTIFGRTTGVSSLQFQLPDSTNLGRWDIRVEKEEGDSKTHIVTEHFTVEEFVNPTFEVNIEVDPPYIVTSSELTLPSIFVKAKYTFGKGVQGNCIFRIEQEEERLFILLKYEMDESGVVEIPSSVLTSIRATSDVVLNAVVTDITGRRENTSFEVKTFPSRERIKFLQKTTREIKPGLPAFVAVRLTDQLGNPLDSDTTLKVKVMHDNIQPEELYMTVPAGQRDAFVKYTPKRQENAIKAEYGRVEVQLQKAPEVEASTSIALYLSKVRDEAIVIEMEENSNVSVGSEIDFKVHLIPPRGISNVTYFYLIRNQSNIVIAEKLKGSSIQVNVTKEMCPSATMFVYMTFTYSEETWFESDQVKIKPTGCFSSQVNIKLKSDIVRSGASTEIQIDVRDGQSNKPVQESYDIFYMAVDKRSTLLQGGTALNEDMLRSAISLMYDADWDRPIGIVGNIGKRRHQIKGRALQLKESSVMPKVRRYFPDTWLWGHAKSEPSGKFVQTVKLPDSITAWEVSAFAVNEKGISVTRAPTSLTAFRRFFLTLNLPYSVKRSEVFQLKVTVFNYNNIKVQAIVGIRESEEFMVFGGTNEDGWHETATTIDANSASTVQFRIGVVKAGLVKFQVKATDPVGGDSDEVLRNLLVEHNGVERIGITNRIMVVEDESQDLSEIFHIPWPGQGVSSGSERVEVKVTGEIFGQALPNLEKLVVIPTGCGEQTMMRLAPNIFGLSYIEARQLKDFDKLVLKMENNMRTGYVRQVSKFRHSDGSYSVWGPSNVKPERVGSTWLTAFVIKCFSRAAEYITIDENIIAEGMAFLKKRQASAGNFIEMGKVIHDEFFQSNEASSVALTSNVLISILEAPQTYRVKIQSVVDKAVQYLLKSLDLSKLGDNKRALASIAYVLSLTDLDERTRDLIGKVLSAAQDDNPPWERYDASDSRGHESQIRVSPMHLEVAAYVLLTYVRLGQLDSGFKLMRWLTTQQNHNGGFKSTKDTVKVLQALSEFGLAFTSVTGRAIVTVEELAGPGNNASFALDVGGPRSVLLQTVELPSKTEQVGITLSGQRGVFAVIKIVYFYHEVSKTNFNLEPQEVASLDITTTSKRLSQTVQKVETCVQSISQIGETLDSDADGMYVTTLFLPSGEVAFDSAETILAENPMTSLVETLDGNIHFYLPEAPTTPQCLVARVERQLEFEVQRPGYARVYPYYNPDLMNETTIAVAPLPAITSRTCSRNTCSSKNVNGRASILDVSNVLLNAVVSVFSSLALCLYA